jgi:hypothetical protein
MYGSKLDMAKVKDKVVRALTEHHATKAYWGMEV